MNARILTAAALLALIGTAAQAKIYANATRPGNFSFNTATAMAPLDSAGNTTLVVTNNKSKTINVALTYSAECSAAGGTADAWIDLDILVNGVAIAPTSGASDAFCHSTAAGGFGQWLRPSITLVVPLVPGPNNIQIQGRLNNGATGGWLGDSALVVMD